MSEEQVVTYELEGEIALVGLNRPDKRNCFNPEVQKGLRDAIAGTLLKAPAGEQPGPAAPADPGQAAVPGPADGGAVRV